MKELREIIKIKTISKLIFLTLVVFVCCSISIYIQNEEYEKVKINEKDFKSPEGQIAVYLSGAINSPGVYSFNEGIRLEEALNLIGGVKVDSDLTKLNLSKVLLDSEKIVVPYKQKDYEEMIEFEEQDVIKGKMNYEKDENKEKEENNEKININKADMGELKSLTGIGEVTAKKIIEYRKVTPFTVIDDIKKVSGIGESKFNKIKDKIIVK